MANCTHGRTERECETCAAWESAVHNQRRAEQAEQALADCQRAHARVVEALGDIANRSMVSSKDALVAHAQALTNLTPGAPR